MITTRNEFLKTFCNACIQPSNHKGCGQTFQSILEPITCPAILASTHKICPFCLELYPTSSQHKSYCIFTKSNLSLVAAGWSTPTSNTVLRAIRNISFPYRNLLMNLIKATLDTPRFSEAILIPVPMNVSGKKDSWTEIIRAAVESQKSIQVYPILERHKRLSTRNNPAQLRKKILEEEYSIRKDSDPSIEDKKVILFDDNVTTGNTMVFLANQLRRLKPAEIIPVAIERHATARVLQRCPPFSLEECAYFKAV